MQEFQTPIVASGLEPIGKKRRRTFFILKIAVSFIILAGGILVITLATKTFDPFWNPLRPSPREILKEASSRFEELKTFHFDVSFEKKIRQPQQETVKNFMMVSGNLDNINKGKPSWRGETKIGGNFERGQFLIGWEKIIIGENSWFKLTILPSSQFLEIFAFDTEKVKDKWVKLEEDSFRDLFGRLSVQSEVEVIKKMVTNEGLFRLKKTLPDEKIKGNKAYHYLFDLEGGELKKLIPEISELLPTEAEELERFREVRAEIWIGKEDKLIYKAKLESEADFQELKLPFLGTMALKVEISLSEFNIPLEIKPPQKFDSFLDIFGKKDFNFFSFPEQF